MNNQNTIKPGMTEHPTPYEVHWYNVSNRLTQLETRNKVLEEIVKDLIPMAKDGYKFCVSNGSHQDFLEDDRAILRRAEQALNKK